METTLKSIVLFLAVFLTGLSAGLFYAWSVSVIPGTKNVQDPIYLEAMQSINRAILNPGFFLIFFGSLICLSIASIYEFHSDKTVFLLFLGASICYFLGTVGVTALGNVPLNNQLEALDLINVAKEDIASFREFYETNWNRLHLVRTGFALIAFLLSLIAVFNISE